MHYTANIYYFGMRNGNIISLKAKSLNLYQRLKLLTDEGSVPKMRIWSILLIQSDLRWCIHLSRSLFYIITDLNTHVINLYMANYRGKAARAK